MPIRVDYSPVGTLMNLARSAGEGQQRREGAAHDLAFTQMALQAQTQNAQIAATMQRNDQAFQLQRAAMERQARTPTRAAAGRGPLVQEFDKTLGRMVTTRGWEQQDINTQLEQLETIRIAGDYTPSQIETARLRIMAGRGDPFAGMLERRGVEQVSLTPAQTEARKRTLYLQGREDLEAERRAHYEKSLYEGGGIRDQKWQDELTAITKAIEVHDVKYRQDVPGGVPGDVPDDVAAKSWPASKDDLVVDETYRAPDGSIRRWTGSMMIKVKG